MTGSVMMRGILALIAVALGVWNYFLRDSIVLPWLSEQSTTMVWIIAGIIIAITIILNWTGRD